MHNGSFAEYIHMVKKNTLLEGKQYYGTLKRKDTNFLNDVTLSLCFSYSNVLYATQQGVFFVPCDHIQQRAHNEFPLSTTSLFKIV